MSDSTYVAFDVLTNDNYNTWRMQAEALLRVFELWDYVEEEKTVCEDADKRELWLKKDKRARSELILHISSSVLPLVENCETSREVWLRLADVYGKKGEKKSEDKHEVENSDTDNEDAIINDIESCVGDFFEIFNVLSEEKITDKEKKSLSKKFADDLFSQLKINSIKKLPNEKIIVDAISDFIDVLAELSKTEMKERKNELSGELIDILLVKLDINPHKNGSNDARSDANAAEIRENDLDAVDKKGSSGDLSKLISTLASHIAKNQSEAIRNNEVFSGNEIPHELYGQLEHETPMRRFVDLYTPPPTPSPKKTYKCGVCRAEGHNRTTCPLNKSTASASKSSVRIAETPKRSPKEPTATSATKSTAKTPETPKRSLKCGVCGVEGHNRTTCPLNKPAVTASNYSTKITETPRRSYRCGECGDEGHNRSSCPRLMKSNVLSSKPTATSTPARSYACGLCGEEGHNRTTCPYNASVTSTPSPRSANRCGTCGREGHNSRTCGRRETSTSFGSYTSPISSFSSYSTPERSYSSYSSPTPSYSGGGSRSYTCSNCGGSGHNRRTCSG